MSHVSNKSNRNSFVKISVLKQMLFLNLILNNVQNHKPYICQEMSNTKLI